MRLEIKIPKEIKNYHESIFFGLSMRQMICSVLGIAVAVGIYFGLRGALGQETVSWVCILGAAPFAFAGFFSYNGLTLEKFVIAWFRSEFLCAGPRVYKCKNIYMSLLLEMQQQALRPQKPLKKPPDKKKTNQRKGAKRK